MNVAVLSLVSSVECCQGESDCGSNGESRRGRPRYRFELAAEVRSSC